MSHSVVFLGTSAFAVPCLQALAADERFDVKLVVTQPDRPVGRKQALTPPPVKVAAQGLKIPVIQPEKLNAEFASLKSACSSADFLVVVSYGQILSDEVLSFPKIAPVNVHASLLPKLRGASPIQHAILQGDKESGVTVQRMVKELDAGPILSAERITLGERETFTTLHDKLAQAGAGLLVRTLSEPLVEKMQMHSDVTFCGKLEKKDGIADPATMTAETIDRMVRALSPWPGVTWEEKKLLQTELSAATGAMPLACKDGTTLYVVTLQPAGGKPMTGQAFLHGKRLS